MPASSPRWSDWEKEITREAVLSAIAEHDQLGQDAFLDRYGFRPARSYFLIHNGRTYDSKAIVGVAHRYVGDRQPLKPDQFSGGEATVGRLLRRLGFNLLVDDGMTSDDLVKRISTLHVRWANGQPALYQPITLLWAIGRAHRGEPRIESWEVTKEQVGELLGRFGFRGERPRPDYPVAALCKADLWELETGGVPIPAAHGDAELKRWFDNHAQSGGLAATAYELFRDSVTACASAVRAIVDTYFQDVRHAELLEAVGLSDMDPAVQDSEATGLRETGDWTESENRAIVGDYLAMLALECEGVPYNKAEHNRALIEAMGGTRNRAAIERKHQNISAVMLQLGLPYIKGYKPLPNIQEALRTEVRHRLETDPVWFVQLQLQVQPPSPAEPQLRAALRQVPAPQMPPEAHGGKEPNGRKVDYGLLQQESKRVGNRGEELVFNLEKETLEKAGRADLAADVIWVARDIGDGKGYDIKSFKLDGQPRYIEVKATKLGTLTPFYITSAELDFARRHQGEYAIYRVVNVDGEAPEFYVIEGDLDTVLAVEPVTYRARPA